jgi:glycosyltransferase involved in cell wall biosynthesis
MSITVSIVVPNFNGGATLGRALRSLLDQHYGNIEILVADGGSTDGSLDVIRSFTRHLSWWVSEPDGGQAAAINKGLARASGEIVNWLCSDDELLPGTLDYVAAFFSSNPEADFVAGACEMVYEGAAQRDFLFTPRRDYMDLMPAFNGVMQPSCFWRRRIMTRTPPLDESFHYGLDAELWCFFKQQGARMAWTDRPLSRFIQSGANKTAAGGARIGVELDRIYRRYAPDRIPLSFWYRHLRYPFELALGRDRGLARLCLLRPLQAAWIAALMPFYGYRRVRHMSWPS